MIREQAPNARVGVCPGDFSPDRDLEPLLGPAASELDFLAFQEMRASTDSAVGRDGYLGAACAGRGASWPSSFPSAPWGCTGGR